MFGALQGSEHMVAVLCLNVYGQGEEEDGAGSSEASFWCGELRVIASLTEGKKNKQKTPRCWSIMSEVQVLKTLFV